MGKRYTNSHRRSVRRRKKSPETIFWVILIAVLAIAGGGFWVHNSLLASGKPGRDSNAVLPLSVVGEDEKPDWVPKVPETHTSILLLGLDSFGMCDVIMILSYDMRTYESSLISLQRDTFVHEQTWADQDSGQDHLSWANNRGMGPESDFHAGARLTALTVENLLDIDLHAYASITFDGFVELVDLIGGVVVDVAPAFAQREGGALPTGKQRLNGEQALIYARHRQNPRIPEPGSESQAADRVIRNQRLLKAMLEQAKTLQSDELLAIVDQLDSKLYTSLEDWDILDLANIMYNRNPDEIRSVVLPGEGMLVYQERIENETYYFYLDSEESNLILRELGLK